MGDKLNILWVGEFSLLNTGYSVYARELLSRLYQTNKFHLNELACYGEPGDPKQFDVPWTVYGNLPPRYFLPPNEQEEQTYKSNPINQFGEWRFNEVALDCRADVVISVTDPWMNSYQGLSPYRRLFHQVMMPTLDSVHQSEHMLAQYIQADGLLAYENFGREVIENESGGTCKVFDIAPMGANELFKPVLNKREHKQILGLDPTSIVIGTTMRNQKRKLFPDLIQSFAVLVDKNKDIANNLYLYLHTSYPDLSCFNIPQLIRESGVGNKIYFTYICKHCGYFQPTLWRDCRAYCPRCGKFALGMADTQKGATTEQLAAVYNLFDVYVQYSLVEGFGAPMVEAASCGVPVIGPNYSATASVVSRLGGTLIDIDRYFYEPETSFTRSYPSNNNLIAKLSDFIHLPEQIRLRKGRQSHLLAKQHYDWDKTAETWMRYLDNVKVENKWGLPPRLHQPNLNVPQLPSIEMFLQWCIANVLGEPEKGDSYFATKLARDLNYGATIYNAGGPCADDMSHTSEIPTYKPFGPKELVNYLAFLCERRNRYELMRVNYDKVEKPAFIQLKKVDDKNL